MGDYRRLKVWHKARALKTLIYEVTERFPLEERYGLRAQTRRATLSIMANLAEGCGRNRDGELLRFVSIALGSANELECHLTAAVDGGFLRAGSLLEAQRRTGEIKKMLAGLSKRLRENLADG